MNAIRSTRALNKLELENAVAPSASWHADYRDTAYVYIGGLPLDLTEGDVVAIFSQYGNPTHLNLVRDRDTGKSRGFAFLKYEDQRSCDLAVDNLGGAEVLGRMLRVDHSRYKKKEGEDEDTWRIDRWEAEGDGADAVEDTQGEESPDDGERRRKIKKRSERRVLKEERELEDMLAVTQDGEEQDPMRDYLIQEKRDEVQRARERAAHKDERHRHAHRRKHRDRGGDRDRGRDERADAHKSGRRRDDPDADPDSRRRHRDSHADEERGEDRHRSRREDDSGGADEERRSSRRQRSRSPGGDRERRVKDRDRRDEDGGDGDRKRRRRDRDNGDADDRRRRPASQDGRRGDRDRDY